MKTKPSISQPMNILVMGKTGVGKSTLINAVFGENVVETGIGHPVTQHIRKVSTDTMPLNIYDTKGLELKASDRTAVLEEVTELIVHLSEMNKETDYLHMVWYCINAQTHRLETEEISLIETLVRDLPVVVVVTQSYGDTAQAFIEEVNEQLTHLEVPIVPVLATPLKFAGFELPSSGLETLIDVTDELLPKAMSRSFINAQKVHLQKKLAAANQLTKGYLAATFTTSFVPIPFADAVALVPIQVAMLAQITKVFNFPIKKSVLTHLVSALIGTSLTTMIGRYTASALFKLVPGVGSVAGGAISGGVAAGMTQLLASSYIHALMFVSEEAKNGQQIAPKEVIRLTKEYYQASFKKEMKKWQKKTSHSEDEGKE